jgi:photosystem II stability/assembly factor-like uncharacterized protein
MSGGRFLRVQIVFRAACLLALTMLSAGHAGAQWWSAQHDGLDTNLRGVSASKSRSTGGAVSVWASGSNGVILRSPDLGKNWTRLHVDGGDKLDFRGIVGFGEKTAYVMSSGDGENSRIYKTIDGGAT